MCNKRQSIIINKEGKQLKRFYVRMYVCMHACMYAYMYACMYVYTLRTAASVAVPKLVIISYVPKNTICQCQNIALFCSNYFLAFILTFARVS